MRVKIVMLFILLSTLYGCSFPRPEVATTKMKMDVTRSEWATMADEDSEMDISDFDLLGDN